MSVSITRPDPTMVQFACSLYNTTRASALPAASGAPYGIDATVHAALIDLTETGCKAIGIPFWRGNALKGMCLWASVVAAKFFVHRNHYRDSRVICVVPPAGKTGGNHFFVVARSGTAPAVICDITSKQFQGPDFVVGTVGQAKTQAAGASMHYARLSEAYKAGAATDVFVI